MRHGDVLRIPDSSNPAVRVKTEDTQATMSNITETQQNITVNRQAYAGMQFEDIAEIQSNWPLRDTYTKKMGYSLAAYIEGDLTSGLASLPASFSQLVGTLGVDPGDDDWLRAVQYLDDGDVPRDDRFIYASPSAHISLLKLEKFTNANFVGQARAERAVLRAYINDAYDCPVYLSSLANNSPSAADQSYAWMSHRRGVALIQQRNPTPHVDYQLLDLGPGVIVDCIYQFAERLIAPSTAGGGTANDRHCVAVRAA